MVKRTEIEIIEQIKDIFECDFCGETQEHHMSSCEICGKHYCEDCGNTHYDTDDYPHKLCHMHYIKTNEYNSRLKDLEDEHERQVDALYKEIMGVERC